MADEEDEALVSDEFYSSKLRQCCMCEGFYGPNFGWPVCNTCHIFLFPPNINRLVEDAQYIEKADSDDSGNEEPNAESDFFMQQVLPEVIPERVVASPLLPDVFGEQVLASPLLSDYPERVVASAVLPLPATKPDRITERINALSCPRDYQTERVPDGLVDSLPPEVLLGVFRYLDDISLLTVANVCQRWRLLLEAEICDSEWKQFTRRRWPLFSPNYHVKCWKTLFTKLLESVPCRYCLESRMLQSMPPIEENSWRHRRLRSEVKTLRADPPEGIQATPLDCHCCHWQASITGPQGSPYQGGLFFLYLQIPQNYPMRPPVVRFITKVFHPNVSWHGDIGLDSIHHNWSLALTISKVLISIQSLLTDPFCHVSMRPEVARLYQRDRRKFERLAQLWTWRYAMHDYVRPQPQSPLHSALI